MDGDQGGGPVGQFQPPPAQLGDGDGAAEQAAHRARSERDDDRWLDHLPFELEPDLAALDFVGVGTLVQTALAAHLVLEMLHRVGDENLRAGDLRFRQGAVEDLPGGRDERLAGKVFLVAGLLAHQHQVRMAAPFAGDRGQRVQAFSALASSASDLIAGTTSSSSWVFSGTGGAPDKAAL